MQQGLLSAQAPSRSKKALLFAAVGVVAVVGIIACAVFVRQPAVRPTQYFEVNGVENFIADAFAKWTAKFNKVYATKDEMIYRMKIFRDNFYKIKEISDQGNDSFTVGLNVMADLTHEEFMARYVAGLQKKEERNVKVLETVELPDKIDWREKGVVAKVKDQGFCGSCWAFSATGALEGLHAIKAGSLVTYSEQELVDCSRDYGNYGCNGGLMTYAFEYVRDKGIATDTDYKYEGVDRQCRSAGKARAYQVSGYTDVEENNEDQLAAAVANQPVSVAVDASSSAFQFYTSGVIDTNACGTSLNHGILAVGYDNTASKAHWIVKNSWGAGWGDKGYVRIKKNTSGKKGKGICGIAMMNTYPNA